MPVLHLNEKWTYPEDQQAAGEQAQVKLTIKLFGKYIRG